MFFGWFSYVRFFIIMYMQSTDEIGLQSIWRVVILVQLTITNNRLPVGIFSSFDFLQKKKFHQQL